MNGNATLGRAEELSQESLTAVSPGVLWGGTRRKQRGLCSAPGAQIMHFSKDIGPGSSRGEESSLISLEGRYLEEIFPFIVRFLLLRLTEILCPTV